jgi:hypothetical protein
VPTVKGGADASLPPPRFDRSEPPPPPPPPLPERSSTPPQARPRPAAAEVVLPSARPPPLDLELTPPPRVVPAASFTLDLPGPEAPPPSTPRSPVRSSPPPRSMTPTVVDPNAAARARSTSPPLPVHRGAIVETRPPPTFDPRAEPDSSPRLPVSRPAPRRSPLPDAFDSKVTSQFRSSPPPPNARPTPLRPTPTPPPADLARAYMRGATLPPYRSESPAPLLPSAPLFPRSTADDELVEHLSLPPGVGAEPVAPGSAPPQSVLEARVQFTMLARELGLDYRLKRGIDLRADVTGIEAMQSVLLETFPSRLARNSDEAYELRRHGALLSEILARRLDAEWHDISPNDLGHWAMIVPPDTRVWPFGRVARLVAMGHKERDLVAYFLELKSRARGR